MERKVKVICSVVGFLGLLSVALFVAAEATRVKRLLVFQWKRLPYCLMKAKTERLYQVVRHVSFFCSQIQFTSSSTCLYPNSPAFGLGLTAAVSLMVAQIIITIAAGCFYCTPGSYQSDCHRTWAVIFFVMSWVVFVKVLLKLLSGAAPHGHHGNETMYFGTHPCYFVKSGVFGYAATLSFAAVIYEITYLDLESEKTSNEAGIAKVHPQGATPSLQHPPA